MAILLFSSLMTVSQLSAQDLYWEEPEVMVPSGGRFPDTGRGGGRAIILWHEYERSGGVITNVSISFAVREREDAEWRRYDRALGPFDYTGEEVPIASPAVNEEGEIFVAVASTGQRIDIYQYVERSKEEEAVEPLDSEDPEKAAEADPPPAEPFESLGAAGREGAAEISVAPRLYVKSNGGLILYVTKPFTASAAAESEIGSLGLTYSLSESGRTWSEFTPLLQDSELSYIYLPSHVSFRGDDYLAFQATPPDSRFFQLYLLKSEDGGRSWSEPKRITAFEETQIDDDPDPNNYDNQRAHLNAAGGSFLLSWERRYAGNTPPQVYYAELDEEGNLKNDPQRVTSGSNSCRDPRTIIRDGTTYLVWFDDRKGDYRVFVAYREGISWRDQDVSIMRGSSTFARSFVFGSDIYLVWENTTRDSSRIVLLKPDRSVPVPDIDPLNFRAGTKAKQDVFRIRWNLPQDSSGIAGFNYSIDRKKDGEPEKTMQILRQEERLARAEVEKDGEWYFHVIARDYAGNWSDTATVSFNRDTTPPPPVEFVEHETNEKEFLPSNTSTIKWKPPEEEEISGYTYRLQYLAGQRYDGSLDDFTIKEPPSRIRSRDNSFSFYNMDNGLWALTVSPLDSVGNVGPPETYYFRLNNYIPVTYITRINMEQDRMNRYLMDIYGRGFSVGGEIEQIMLDADGEKPYDIIFPADSDTYEVKTDRHIEGPTIQDMSTGSYRIGLVHPERGVYFTNYTLDFEATGTVKFGDFRLIRGEEKGLVPSDISYLSMGNISFFIVMLLLTVLLIFTVYKLSVVTREGRRLHIEVQAIIHSQKLPAERKKERLKKMEKRRGGLRIKFVLLIMFLVLIIVLLVSLPLGNYMIRTQEEDLTQGLQENTRVLIESINTGAQKFLPEENNIELGRLPSQVGAAEDAKFVTITGPPSSDIKVEEKEAYNYLWSSNNPDITEKIVDKEKVEEDAEGNIDYTRGGVRIEDEISKKIPELKEEINSEAKERVGEMTDRLAELQQEAQQTAQDLVTSQDQDTAQLLTELQNEITRLSRQIEEELAEIGDVGGSSPEFNTEEILTGPTEFVFYKPIVYQETGQEGVYYHGMVRLGISTKRIRQEITNSRDTLIRQTALVAFIAIGIGIVGALILATIIIRPIKKLEQGVIKIRDTSDMTKFEDRIKIKTKDEISTLANTINEMTDGLVKAELAKKDLIFGKETQKRFIPLEESGKEKLTTGKKETEHSKLFGYYEGAKGVSGDYFDYIEYAPERFAIIKCDVAGKGIPASLIMVEVATVFHNYLNEYMERNEGKKNPPDPDISKLILGINRLVQERGFEGKFAALMITLVNMKTGATTFSNAGDSLVHIYDSVERKTWTKELARKPAAGVFDNDMVEMSGGFVKEPHKLKKGDAILLYTDGIEEAMRSFRNENFEIVTCQEPDLKENEEHGGSHLKGAAQEELTNARIYDIADAVFARGSYRLHKYHNPVGDDEDLDFDFSSCEGTIEDVVLALVSVEKVFRIYPHPSAGERDIIEVDKEIDTFLKEHFLQYDAYFSRHVEEADTDQYIAFSHLREDEQFDDLTILGVSRKKEGE